MIAGIAAAAGTWPVFGTLFLLSCVFSGYLVPKVKAPIFADAAAKLPHKVLDEYFPSWTPQIAESWLCYPILAHPPPLNIGSRTLVVSDASAPPGGAGGEWRNLRTHRWTDGQCR